MRKRRCILNEVCLVVAMPYGGISGAGCTAWACLSPVSLHALLHKFLLLPDTYNHTIIHIETLTLETALPPSAKWLKLWRSQRASSLQYRSLTI
jgi:hypothetical protein